MKTRERLAEWHELGICPNLGGVVGLIYGLAGTPCKGLPKTANAVPVWRLTFTKLGEPRCTGYLQADGCRCRDRRALAAFAVLSLIASGCTAEQLQGVCPIFF